MHVYSSNLLKGRYSIQPAEAERIAIEDSYKDISSQTDKSMVGINI